MKITQYHWIIALGVLALTVSACGNSNATLTPPTRLATQTPWIIYIPVTTTPEPATLPLLPTAQVRAAATRTPVRVVAKPTVPPTKPPSVVPTAKPTAGPACSIGTVALTFPGNGDPRGKGSAFEMKWTPPAALSGLSDPNVGYKVELTSRRGSKVVNGATVYVSHNKYFQDGKFIYAREAVTGLAAGDNATVTWQVTIVKASNGFDDQQQNASGNIIPCGSPSAPSDIKLEGFD